MKIKATPLKDCVIVAPAVFKDERGYFFESFNQKKFNELTENEVSFVQDNQSFSDFGVIRGLHAQSGCHAQAKLVRVIQGEVLDVVVDIRADSPTFGQHFSIKLSAENNLQLFVPRGFLHGFSVLSPTATFFYKCDNFYNKESEIGVVYNDIDLNIDWMVPNENQLVSEKDLLLPSFKNLFE